MILKVGVGRLEGVDAELEALDLCVVVQVETLEADDALLREVGTWPVAPPVAPRVGGQAWLGPLLRNNLPINLGWARPVAPHNRTLRQAGHATN